VKVNKWKCFERLANRQVTRQGGGGFAGRKEAFRLESNKQAASTQYSRLHEGRHFKDRQAEIYGIVLDISNRI
jgi:hypothetical protein